MNWQILEKQFSSPRLARYRAEATNDVTRAALFYAHNMLLAGSMEPVLGVVEIALRNAINHELSRHYGRPDWWVCWTSIPVFSSEIKYIQDAKDTLLRRKESCTPDKIIAELHFGFWCTLFNAKFQHDLWTPLRLGFPKCPKAIRKRQTISTRLQIIRHLRNRVSHHEPLIWLKPTLIEHHAMIMETIGWFDPGLVTWVVQYDPFPLAWAQWRAV